MASYQLIEDYQFSIHQGHARCAYSCLFSARTSLQYSNASLGRTSHVREKQLVATVALAGKLRLDTLQMAQ
jgi:hypothetical protein